MVGNFLNFTFELIDMTILSKQFDCNEKDLEMKRK